MKRIGHRLFLGAAIALLAGVSSVFAQDAGAPTAQSQAYTLDIPVMDLHAALQELALASRHKLFYESAVVSGRRSVALKGTYTTEDALRELLAGTGLEFEITPGSVVLVRPRKDAAPHPAVVPDSSPGAPAAAPDGAATPATAAGNGALTGQVLDDSTRSALAGALVRVLETGRTETADDLGSFRFRDLPAGEYTLSISYLGYSEKLWRVSVDAGTGTAMEFPLTPSEWDVAEVTVFGNRSARALALNQQRTADNNAEIVSADMLGNFTGTTISEALRRVAGVSFMRDPNTGSGTNIMIRGLEPDMNAVKLNGLNLPVGNGTSRSANLNNILADSVSKITINKTLLASHDSSGTGGLVEIETKSPLERPHRYVNLAVEGGRRGADFGDDFVMSGTASRTFGRERNLGLSASVQYAREDHQNSGFRTYLKFGQYVPLSPVGTPTFGIDDFDPRLTFPYEPGAADVYADGGDLSFAHALNTTLAVTVSGEWQPTPLNSLKFDVQRSRSEASTFTANGSINMQSDYIVRPVRALNGQQRLAITYGGSAQNGQYYGITDGQSSVTDTYSLRGSSSPGKWQINYTLGFAHGADRSPENSSLNLGFQTSAELPYGEPLGPDDFLPSAVDATEGIIITPYPRVSGRGVQLPLFRPGTWDRFNDADNYYFGGASQYASSGRNDRRTADINANYQIHWRALESLETGVNFEKTDFRNSFQTLYISPASTVIEVPGKPDGITIFPSLAPLGMTFRQTDLSRVGHSGAGFDYLHEGGVRDFFANLDTYSRDKSVISSIETFLPTDLERQQLTQEQSVASYLQGKLDFGRLDVIAGVRLSQVEVRAVSVVSPFLEDVNFVADVAFARRFARLLDDSVTQTDLLPRIALNFRQSDNLVFRGGYFLTTARPAISQLSSTEYVALYQNPAYSPRQDLPLLNISRGNPGLKPAITHNFDADAEYYDADIGVIRLGVFYKRIDNSLQSNEMKNFHDLSGIDLPDDPRFDSITPQNTYITLTIPQNSDRPATIRGAEIHVERQFTFLPGWWNGLGVYGNFAYTESDAWLVQPWQEPVELDENGYITTYRERLLVFPHARFNFQPATSGTIALTYNKRGIDATLAYGFQDRYQNQFVPNNLKQFTEGVGTLDFRAAYFFDWGGMKWRTFLEGTDLLKGPKDPDLQNTYGGVGGLGKYYDTGTYLGGREIRVGVSATF